jgi:CubicO group peptidase (beta-lactamase class C family)
MSKITTTAVFLLSALNFSNVQANNGQVAYAQPLTDRQITVDGDLSDWPISLTKFAIERDFYGQDMPDSSDFSAYFRTVYSESEGAIYIALQITDQSHFVNKNNNGSWNQNDSVTLYVDAKHSPRGSGSHLYTAMGEHRLLIGPSNGWDPDVVDASWDNVDVVVNRRGNETTYEWKVILNQAELAGRSIGIDFLISDTDKLDGEDEQSLYIWGQYTGKSQAADRLGDLLFLPKDSVMGTLKGLTRNELPSRNENALTRIKIVSKDNPQSWLHIPVDDKGYYNFALPAGEYRVSSAYSSVGDVWRGADMIDQSEGIDVSVEANEVTDAPEFVIGGKQAPNFAKASGVLFDYDSSKKHEMDKVIEAYMEHYKVPGASIALVKDGRLVYHNVFGVKNAYTQEPVTTDTLFEAASITKIVFAFAVNRLAQRGVIDLDKPLYQYLPFEEIAHDPRYKKITGRHVLSHQTGFPNWSWQNPDGKLDIKFYPGIKYGYSGEGFEYLGRVVSHITGKSLEEVIMTEVQEPMGFQENTFFSDNPQLQQQVSHGHYTVLPTPIDIPREIGVAHSMHTEAKIFSNFMISLMQKKGLSEQGYTEMFEPQVEVPINPDEGDFPWPQRYGLGFHLGNTPHGLAYGHGGSNGDFNCLFEVYDEHNAGFIIFTNNDTGTSFYKHLHQYLITGKS